MTTQPTYLPVLGVVIVTYTSADVILDCLESLLAAPGVRLRIVVVDNASPDATITTLRNWADGTTPYAVAADIPFPLPTVPKPMALLAPSDTPPTGTSITLIQTGRNAGFAAGVNAGLAYLALDTEISRFWVLNPDSVVPPQTPVLFATHGGPTAHFSLMGGRVTYLHAPDMIQIDGGTINRRTGVTGNLNLGCSAAATPQPDATALDFIMGASMVASREFYEATGPMEEAYFLYYEEVDWAQRRGDLPLSICPDATILHRAGTAIGSPTLERGASPFSVYFKHRARMIFTRRFLPRSLPGAYAYSLAKAAQLALKGQRAQAMALLRATHGLKPSAAVKAKLHSSIR
ncbi:MAG: glycosyltransferase family 2 protein [Paracoccaceae bacterium]|nr:glycosyltransferase family 2 protein [Paracoccaceae bacterium]